MEADIHAKKWMMGVMQNDEAAQKVRHIFFSAKEVAGYASTAQHRLPRPAQAFSCGKVDRIHSALEAAGDPKLAHSSLQVSATRRCHAARPYPTCSLTL